LDDDKKILSFYVLPLANPAFPGNEAQEIHVQQGLGGNGFEGTGGHAHPTPVTSIPVDKGGLSRIERHDRFGGTHCSRWTPLAQMALVLVDVRYPGG
jgi:hypothetical protein